ncbi:uncharacterized protein LOC135936344 [Cloeon dipterum]|uniref:uncharacterized protein LOC135936344 n=1 Tax=Cloeon dipterum TaxID=197152 RepID=UPI0032200672
MRRALLVLLSLALCAAQTSDSDVLFPAPFFDEGENLSSQNCGNETAWNQSAVFIKHSHTGEHCYFFIPISQRTLLGLGICPLFDQSDTYFLEVFPNYCHGRTASKECSGVSAKILDLIDIATQPYKGFAFKILITETMPSVISPVCLFNRDNAMDSQFQRESPYFEWSAWNDNPPIPKNVTGQSNCKTVLSSYDWSYLDNYDIPIQNVLCVKSGRYHDYLINFYKGRYFLRGVQYYRTEHFYTDILPYIDEIARHARDISVLRPIPPTKPPRGFKNPGNVSFPNCGWKQTSTRIRRGNEGSSEDFQPSKLIFGGNVAHIRSHPWHASIENEVTGQTCGGTLISLRAVLTAAHCLHGAKAKDFRVTVGMDDKRKRRAPGVQTRKVRSLIMHPKYDPAELNSDVALMILKKKFNITDDVRPICLWNDDSDSNLARVAETEAMAVGFGLVDNHTRTDILQEARLPIRGHKECYLSSRRFFGKYLRPGDNFCAGFTNGTTVCNGDSGGSLSVKKDGRWFIRGIVSFGMSKKVMFEGEERSFCHPNQYALFADVASYVDWIVGNTPEISFRNYKREKGIDISDIYSIKKFRYN